MLLEHALTRRQFILQLSAVLPFPDTLSNTLGLARGQVDQDRKDRRTIHKVQGPVSAAGTAPHKSSVRGRGIYGSSTSRGIGAVSGISLFCNCLNLVVFFVCLFICLFLGIRCCGVWHMQCLRALC